MKKSMFGIYVNDHDNIRVEAVNGYILDYGCFRFGIRKSGQYTWSITEMSTGMLTGLYVNRKKDIISVLDNNVNLLDTLQKLLNNPDERIKAAQSAIREFYTVQSAE